MSTYDAFIAGLKAKQAAAALAEQEAAEAARLAEEARKRASYEEIYETAGDKLEVLYVKVDDLVRPRTPDGDPDINRYDAFLLRAYVTFLEDFVENPNRFIKTSPPAAPAPKPAAPTAARTRPVPQPEPTRRPAQAASDPDRGNEPPRATPAATTRKVEPQDPPAQAAAPRPSRPAPASRVVTHADPDAMFRPRPPAARPVPVIDPDEEALRLVNAATAPLASNLTGSVSAAFRAQQPDPRPTEVLPSIAVLPTADDSSRRSASGRRRVGSVRSGRSGRDAMSV